MPTIGDRIRKVRERRGEKQPEFAAAMNEAAQVLGIADRYDNTKVSKMEIGSRDVTLQDVQVIASIDPEKRGRRWLAWGDTPQTAAADVPRATHGKTGLNQNPKGVVVKPGQAGKNRGRGK